MLDRELLLHLTLIPGIGPATIQALLNYKNIQDIYHFSVQDFQRLGFNERIASLLKQGLSKKDMLHRELDLLAQHSTINWVTLVDEEYPPLLKHIYMPPVGLYVRGHIPTDQTCFSIVGSRAAQIYARKSIELLIPDLLDAQCVIVSGGALGVDTMAHQTAIHNGGKTVVVLGSGMLRPYPVQNIRLFDHVVEQGGAVVTPFSLEQVPLHGNFPARNRIIAGISIGCLVVQAASKSGALITARFALEQGREVFALPGSIMDHLSEGCHELIKQGASLVSCSQDILMALGFAEHTLKKSIPLKESSSTTQSTDPLINQITKLCQYPISVDDLVAQTGMSVETVQQLLFDLQLKRKISQDFSGLWFSC